MSNNILMIMNSRDIPECIQPLKRLKIDKVWFRGYTETQLAPLLNKFIEGTHYDNYILVSDDVIVNDFALDNIIKYQNHHFTNSVITGWCNLMPNINRGTVSLNPLHYNSYHSTLLKIPKWLIKPLALAFWYIPPLTLLYQDRVNKSFTDIDSIYEQPKIFSNYFVSWALTSIPRDIWLRFPFKYKFTNGKAVGSDILMSLDLYNNDIPMYVARDSFVYHLATHRNYIIGKVKPQVIFEGYNDINGSYIK